MSQPEVFTRVLARHTFVDNVVILEAENFLKSRVRILGVLRKRRFDLDATIGEVGVAFRNR